MQLLVFLKWGGMPVELAIMPEDTFGYKDRQELIRLGFLLEQIVKDVSDVKRLTEHTDTDFESRIRNLEDYRLSLKSSIRTTIVIVSIASTIFGSLAHFVLSRLGL